MPAYLGMSVPVKMQRDEGHVFMSFEHLVVLIIFFEGKKRQHCNKQVSMKELFLRKVPLQWIRLTDNCLEAPCWATPHLLQL